MLDIFPKDIYPEFPLKWIYENLLKNYLFTLNYFLIDYIFNFMSNQTNKEYKTIKKIL